MTRSPFLQKMAHVSQGIRGGVPHCVRPHGTSQPRIETEGSSSRHHRQSKVPVLTKTLDPPHLKSRRQHEGGQEQDPDVVAFRPVHHIFGGNSRSVVPHGDAPDAQVGQNDALAQGVVVQKVRHGHRRLRHRLLCSLQRCGEIVTKAPRHVDLGQRELSRLPLFSKFFKYRQQKLLGGLRRVPLRRLGKEGSTRRIIHGKQCLTKNQSQRFHTPPPRFQITRGFFPSRSTPIGAPSTEPRAWPPRRFPPLREGGTGCALEFPPRVRSP